MSLSVGRNFWQSILCEICVNESNCLEGHIEMDPHDWPGKEGKDNVEDEFK